MTAGFFDAPDGLHLYREVYPAADGSAARAVVLVVHGYGEHSGRYAHVAAHLSAQGFEVQLFDYRGHGQSAGRRGHVDYFDDYLGDMDRFVALGRAAAAGRPLVLVGHSHGGLLSTYYALRRSGGVDALALSAPFYGLQLRVPKLKRLAGRIFSRVMPTLSLPSGIDPFTLSRDQAVCQAYQRDRWVHHVATARWFTECQRAQAEVVRRASEVTLPTLMLVAGSDRLTDGALAQAHFARFGSANKRLRVYPELYHELFNEPERRQVLDDLVQWLDETVTGTPR